MKTVLVKQPGRVEYRVGEGEELVVAGLVVESGEWQIKVRLVGRGARCRILVVGVGDKQDRQELRVVTEHEAEDTWAMVKVRGLVTGEAGMEFEGLIKIMGTGQRTNAFLEEKVILLSDRARHEARPRLEIEANEVRASHASATGQLDETQIFYLMSRGLGRPEAERMLAIGFLAEAVAEVAEKPREDIMGRVRKLVGEFYV